jgi:dystroglycan 1
VRIEPTFQTVNEFEQVEFRCIASGTPAPTIEWYRRTGTINPNAVISGGLFRIPIVQRSDESEYYCKASNVAGSTEIRTILYVTKSKKPLLDFFTEILCNEM